jgi:hypothetical protein
MPINISNENHRDATVAMEGVRPKRDVRYVDEDLNPVISRRLLKTDVTHDLPELMKKMPEMEDVSEALVEGDPEVDVESFGMFLTETSRVYVGENGIVHSVEEFEVVSNPDGTVRDRRPRKKEPQNVNTDIPLKWTGKFLKKSDAVKRFVFATKKQLAHVNGLTFDFLFDIAKKLHDQDSLLLMRAGENRDRPLVLYRGGRQYNAFLEGRVKGDSYCLILHLSNMELKRPAILDETTEEVEPKGSNGNGDGGKKVSANGNGHGKMAANGRGTAGSEKAAVAKKADGNGGKKRKTPVKKAAAADKKPATKKPARAKK